eukprot:CFRG1540T1
MFLFKTDEHVQSAPLSSQAHSHVNTIIDNSHCSLNDHSHNYTEDRTTLGIYSNISINNDLASTRVDVCRNPTTKTSGIIDKNVGRIQDENTAAKTDSVTSLNFRSEIFGNEDPTKNACGSAFFGRSDGQFRASSYEIMEDLSLSDIHRDNFNKRDYTTSELESETASANVFVGRSDGSFRDISHNVMKELNLADIARDRCDKRGCTAPALEFASRDALFSNRIVDVKGCIHGKYTESILGNGNSVLSAKKDSLPKINLAGETRDIMAKRRYTLRKYKLAVDLILLAFGFSIFGYLITETPDTESLLSNQDMIFPWALCTTSCVLGIITVVSFFVLYNRNEPEIASRNMWFIGQVIICTYVSVISRLFGVLLHYQKLPIKVSDERYWYYYVSVLHAGTWAFIMIVSAATLRLRLIYRIWVCNQLTTTYQTGLVYHIPISLLSVLPALIGTYSGSHMPFMIQYIATYLVWMFLLAEMIFYLCKIRNIASLFTDVGSNIRICSLCFMYFLGNFIYVLRHGQTVIVVMMYTILIPLSFLIIWFEMFGIPIVKVTGNKLGKSWLDTIDLAGLGYKFKNSALSSLDGIIETPFLYNSFVTVCERMHSVENLYFVKAMIPYRRAIKEGEHLLAVGHARDIISTFVTSASQDMQINISCKTRGIFQHANLLDKSSVPESVDKELRAVEERVTGLLFSAKAEFLAMPEVQDHYDKLQACVRAGLIAAGV